MHLVKRFAATIGGVALLAVGAAMMVLPGPGILLIVAGLAVLATEYVWARRLLVKAREQAEKVQEAAVASPLRTAGSVLFAVGMVVVGVLMLVVDDVAWPFLASLLDRVWGPVTGGILVVTGLVLVTTTWITVRTARGEETTHTQGRVPGADSRGATRFQAS
ncbi:PGPGW domain-containing protein [Vallicoccus soli]|uniref:PGPGW domain-containing protein n=1 Tax=Vallicoccus soli TaxID=2339232 RepID=UPI001C49A4FC|nr:PGPGW domain-containing protein [Vallicoccus soli]